MSDWLKPLEHVLATLGDDKHGVDGVIQKLLQQTRTAIQHQTTLPVVTLLLSTGQELTGVLLRQNDSHVLVLAHTPDTSRLSFINSSLVVGITLHDAAKLGQPGTDVHIPSKLELSRQAQILGDTLGVAITLALEENDVARLAAAKLLEVLHKALDHLLADELSKTAFREQIEGIHMGSGETSVQLANKQLGLTIKTLDTLPTSEKLKSDIEALL